jgi:hypothetical protein
VERLRLDENVHELAGFELAAGLQHAQQALGQHGLAVRYALSMAITSRQWRKLVLSMPEAEEKSHFGQPDFRVRNKIFAGLYRDETRGVLKLAPELQSILLDSNPDVFVPAAGAWGRSGWTYVVLAGAELGMLRELVPEAWRLVAPKRLVGASASATNPATPRARKAPARTRGKPTPARSATRRR